MCNLFEGIWFQILSHTSFPEYRAWGNRKKDVVNMNVGYIHIYIVLHSTINILIVLLYCSYSSSTAAVTPLLPAVTPVLPAVTLLLAYSYASIALHLLLFLCCSYSSSSAVTPLFPLIPIAVTGCDKTSRSLTPGERIPPLKTIRLNESLLSS